MKVNAALSGAAAVVVGAALVSCGESPPSDWDQISAEVFCESPIKSTLRDPDSYQFKSAVVHSQSGTYNEYGTATIYFRSRNGFGGYTDGSASCEAYNKNGERWFKTMLN